MNSLFTSKVNEWAARLDGFANLHPLTPDHLAQGALELMVRLSAILAEIVGLDGVNLQPAKIDYLEERTWPRL